MDITKTVRGPLPQVPFEKMTEAVLGKHYELSLVLCADTLARRINKKLRKKHYAPNVLSFPLSKREGEILLNVRRAGREARTYGVTARSRIALLFVHALFHLKGMGHGEEMETKEQKVLRAFGLV